jgi:hypothetical protein
LANISEFGLVEKISADAAPLTESSLEAVALSASDPRPCENSKVRSATRMIFLTSFSKLNALPMWAHEKVLNE